MWWQVVPGPVMWTALVIAAIIIATVEILKYKREKKMNDSTNRLLEFLVNEYKIRGGADTLGTAIRDCLTDLCHINELTSEDDTMEMEERLVSATEVFDEEQEAVRQENKCQVNEG